MKKVHFKSKESVGYFEIPDDAIITIPKGITVNQEGEPEPLPYDPGMRTMADEPDANLPHGAVPENADEDNDHLLPNIG